jgi:hypothetical protein
MLYNSSSSFIEVAEQEVNDNKIDTVKIAKKNLIAFIILGL